MSYLSTEILQDNIVGESDDMEVAINCLNRSTIAFLIVLNKSSVVVGTITDGDIRRGLIRGLALKDKVSGFMKKDFVYSLSSDDDHHYKLSTLSGRAKFLPILNAVGQLVSVYGNFEHKFDIKTAVIMAGGFGKRLGQLTENKPKPLVSVNGKALIEHVLEKLEDAAISKIFITTHYLAEQIEEYVGKRYNTAKIEIIKELVPLGTAGGLRSISFEPHEKFLVMNCDVVSDLRLQNFFQYNEENQYSALISVTEFVSQLPFGVVAFDQQYNFLGVTEKPTQKYYVSSGVNLFSSEHVKLISDGEAIDMPDFINRLHALGLKIGVFPIHEQWSDLGRKEDIKSYEIRN